MKYLILDIKKFDFFDYIYNTETIFLEMKELVFYVLTLFISCYTFAQYTAIPDINFEQALIDQGIDSENTLDGQILTNDINTITTLDVAYYYSITDLTGIQDFTALEYLNCEHNELTVLDISNNLLLEELYCGNSWIDVGPFNMMTELDVSNSINLRTLGCFGLFYLEALDVSQNLILENLYCGFTQITYIDLAQNINLKILDVDYCDLTDLDLTNNVALTHLTVTTDYPNTIPGPNSNQILSLDLSQNVALTVVKVEDSFLEELNLKNGANNVLLNVRAEMNPNLVCITVDNEIAANAGDYPYSEWHVDPGIFYSENCVLSVESVEDFEASLYPNPISDILYIENNLETIDRLEVLDILGKRITTKMEDFTQVDFRNYKSGVYFVKFYAGEAVLTKKVIKK